MKSKTNPLETGIHIFFLICGILSVGFVLFISIYRSHPVPVRPEVGGGH